MLTKFQFFRSHALQAARQIQNRSCASSSATSIAQKLWNDRLTHKSENLSAQPSLPYDSSCIKPRPVSDSITRVHYPLTSDESFRKEYLRFDGGLRFGNILEDMDAITGSVAYLHCNDGNPDTRPLHIVTASVSHVTFRRFLPTKLNLFDLAMTAKIRYVGKSSMLIGVEIAEAESQDATSSSKSNGGSSGRTIVEADFVMVARDVDTQRAAHINPLGDLSLEEQDAFDSGLARIQKEKEEKKVHLDITDPTVEETSYIHGLYKTKALHLVEGKLNSHSVLSNYDQGSEGDAVSDLKRFSVGSTMLQNVVLCQPQLQWASGMHNQSDRS